MVSIALVLRNVILTRGYAVMRASESAAMPDKCAFMANVSMVFVTYMAAQEVRHVSMDNVSQTHVGVECAPMVNFVVAVSVLIPVHWFPAEWENRASRVFVQRTRVVVFLVLMEMNASMDNAYRHFVSMLTVARANAA